MTVDLTQFHEAFYEESFEAIAQMEEALLRLDVGTPDLDLINTIFRVAHSIKGGAATFGFRTFWINRSQMPDEYQPFPPSQRLTGLAGLLS